MRRISGERVRADERMAVREGCKDPGLSTSYVVTSLRKAARHTAYERRISDLGICSMAFGRAFNNNSNNHTDVYSTVIMERPLREISVSFYECRTAKRLPTPRPCQPTCMGLIGLVCLWVAIRLLTPTIAIYYATLPLQRPHHALQSVGLCVHSSVVLEKL